MVGKYLTGMKGRTEIKSSQSAFKENVSLRAVMVVNRLKVQLAGRAQVKYKNIDNFSVVVYELL